LTEFGFEAEGVRIVQLDRMQMAFNERADGLGFFNGSFGNGEVHDRSLPPVDVTSRTR
jgi:hypothetical protein